MSIVADLPPIRPGAVPPQPDPLPLASRGPRFQVYTEVRSRSRRGVDAAMVTPVRWRLLTSNHRCIAVSPDGFATAGEALEAARRLPALVPDARSRTAPSSEHLWWWSLSAGGVEVAASVRGYQRRLECDLALAQFRTLALTAVVQPDLLRFRREGRG